jgi:hypothetical protein
LKANADALQYDKMALTNVISGYILPWKEVFPKLEVLGCPRYTLTQHSENFCTLGSVFDAPGDLFPPMKSLFFQKVGLHEKNAVSAGRGIRIHIAGDRSGGSEKPAQRGWSEGEQRQKGPFYSKIKLLFIQQRRSPFLTC